MEPANERRTQMDLSWRNILATALPALVGASLASAAWAADFTIKLGHLESPTQSRHIHLEKVAELVKERTNGAVEFQLFPQAQLGEQREMSEGVQLGTIEATVSPAAFLGGFNPLISVLDIPFLMPSDPDRANQLRQGPFGQALCESFATRGFKCLGLLPNGTKSFSSVKPIGNLAEFAGQKFRVMDSRVLIEQFNALGASAIALPFGELYTSLQTGVIDGQENALDTIRAMKFHEVQKYVVRSDHGVNDDVILFNPMFWDSLPADYQQIITDAFAEVLPALTAHKIAAMDSAYETIKEAGVDVRVMDEDEKTAFREIMYPATRAAYLAQNGEAGAKLIGLYESEYARITGAQ